MSTTHLLTLASRRNRVNGHEGICLIQYKYWGGESTRRPSPDPQLHAVNSYFSISTSSRYAKQKGPSAHCLVELSSNWAGLFTRRLIKQANDSEQSLWSIVANYLRNRYFIKKLVSQYCTMKNLLSIPTSFCFHQKTFFALIILSPIRSIDVFVSFLGPLLAHISASYLYYSEHPFRTYHILIRYTLTNI